MSLTFQSEPRSHLYYNRWQLRGEFRMAEAWLLRDLDPVKLARRIADRGKFRWRSEDIELVWQMQECMNNMQYPFSRWISWEWVCIYADHEEVFATLDKCVDMRSLRRANITLPSDCVIKQNSSYNLRTYFREKKFDPDKKHSLLRYLLNNQNIYGSNSLMRALRDEQCQWSRRYWYIDHQDPKDTLMLQMLVPGMIRQTLPIVAK